MDDRTAQAVIAVARGYLGTREDPPNSNRNPFSTKLRRGPEFGFTTAQSSWCADFVTVCFLEAGAQLPSIDIPEGFTGCPAAYRYGRQRGELVDLADAGAGDVALFDWNRDGVADHTGIVVAPGAGVLLTIEGNAGLGGRVDQWTRIHRDVLAVWRPAVALPPLTVTDLEEIPMLQFPVAPVLAGDLAGRWCKVRVEAGGHHLRSWLTPWAGVPDDAQSAGLGTYLLDVDRALELGALERALVGTVSVGQDPSDPWRFVVSDDHGDYAFRLAG